MAVLGRSLSFVVCENGEMLGAIAENLQNPQPTFKIYSTEDTKTPHLAVFRDNRGQEKGKDSCYGAGCRVLFTMTSCERIPQRDLTPILVLWRDEEKSVPPLRASLIEGASDPSLSYDRRTGRYHLYYWVNAWSPPGITGEKEEETLFSSVKPRNESLKIDDAYDEESSIQPLARTFTAIRDVPEWFADGEAPYELYEGPSSIYPVPDPPTDPIGEIHANGMWIAPWSDAHLYRFPEEYDPNPPPLTSPPAIPDIGPPPPPTLVPDVNASFLDNIGFASIPFQGPQKAVNNALYRARSGQNLTPSDQATLNEYALTPRRLAYLARCNRVLMHTTGQLVNGIKQDDPENVPSNSGASIPQEVSPPSGEPKSYLVVEQPKPLYVARRGTNKIMAARHKWSSYVSGEDVFITAPLNYRFLAAGTVRLTMGDPQVDFTIHDPSENLGSWRSGSHMPESLIPQFPQILPEKALLGPIAFSTSLVGIMSTPSLWQSY